MIRGGLEGVIRYLQNNKIMKWQIKSGDGANDFVFQSDDSNDFQQNVERMQDILRDLNGRYIVVGRDSNSLNASKNGYKETFFLSDESEKPKVSGAPAANVGMVTVDELERRLNEAHDTWVREQELKDLKAKMEEQKKEIDELKKPINEVIRKLQPLVEPAVGLIARKMMPQTAAPAVAGIARLDTEAAEIVPVESHETMPAGGPEMTTEDEDELLELYAQWKVKDENCIEVLRAICKIGISGQPIMGMPYETVKNMIINAAKE